MLGASFDTVADNKVFHDAQTFGFPLLADPDRAVGTAYEVAREPDHQYAAVPKRISYLIDRAGVIRRAYEVKDVAAHADEVLDDLAQLTALGT